MARGSSDRPGQLLCRAKVAALLPVPPKQGIKRDPAKAFVPRTVMIGGKVSDFRTVLCGVRFGDILIRDCGAAVRCGVLRRALLEQWPCESGL
ncbi:hypothetical protein P7K49_009156 [Saguinus oedipus]|uniref:Uncharacterized protein n=1 Tax=Saguinus oedipus TaxID=9490 RepID=A0ABQ9VJY9_SAGOE|nr:hypothetical protein P7K49_009156 [Saguinus oedipus]